MSDDAEVGRSKRFNRLSGSDSSSREGSPHAKRPKRSFTPTSDDGDLVVPAVGEHIDDTPPPEGQPIIRQAVAFNWDKTATTNLQTYSASATPKQAANCFLPGQAPVINPAPPSAGQPQPAATSSQRSPSPLPPSTPQQSSSRKKKSEGKTRHYNDQFSTQTGRFKVGPGVVHNPKSVEPPPLHRGTGPYSSMYRMSTAAPSTPTTSLTGSVSPASPRIASTSDQTASTGYLPVGVTEYYSTPEQCRSASSDTTIPVSQPKPSTSKPSSKHRSLNERKSTAERPSGQTSQASELNAQYYRRDYEIDSTMSSPSKDKEKASGSSKGRSKDSTSLTPRTHSHPRNSASSSGDKHNSSSGPAGHAGHKPEAPVRQLRMVTILIEDIRSGVADHQLAEVRVPLLERQDRFWADAQEVCEQLQSSPSRIDGPARVYTLRGKYRQFFLRVSADNVDEITSANIQVAMERTLEIVVEPLPQQGVMPLPPQIPRDLLSPGSDSETIGSPVPGQVHPLQGISSDEALKRSLPQKRRRSISPPGGLHRKQFAHISPHSSPPQASTSLPLKKGRKGTTISSYDFSGMSPRSAQYYQDYARNYDIPLPTSPNTPGRMGESQEQIDAAIVFFIKPLVEEDPKWMKYMESKAKPPRVSEILIQCHFIQDKVDELSHTRTPIHWDGAPNMEVRKEHVWQLLHLESPSGPDCEEILALLRLYATDGQRYEDSRVIEMMEDTLTPTGKPYKRFLKLLRQIDQDWWNDNVGDAESDGSSRSAGSRSTSGKGKERDTHVSA